MVEVCNNLPMEKDMLYFLKVSGTIRIGKHQEFQQTVQFIFNQLPTQCVKRELAIDVHNTYHYYVSTLWQSEETLAAFKASNIFDLLKGAFQTLGRFDESMEGSGLSIQTFDVRYHESNRV